MPKCSSFIKLVKIVTKKDYNNWLKSRAKEIEMSPSDYEEYGPWYFEDLKGLFVPLKLHSTAKVPRGAKIQNIKLGIDTVISRDSYAESEIDEYNIKVKIDPKNKKIAYACYDDIIEKYY